MRRVAMVAVAALMAGAHGAFASDAAQIADAERAFAAEAANSGWVSAFKIYAAPEGIVMQPDPINAQESLAGLPPEANTKGLMWWPVWAGISRSGDLGFTTGPYTAGDKAFGHYFTVWRKQDDGSWKWIYDGGPRNAERSPHGPETETTYLAASTGSEGSSGAALKEVAAAEEALAGAAKSDVKAAYAPYLAADGRIMGSPLQPATKPSEFEAELAARASGIAFSPLHAESSEAGDLVFTYGDAKWSRNGAEERGHYVRMWQKRSEGWKLVFDELLVVPPPPPAKSE